MIRLRRPVRVAHESDLPSRRVALALDVPRAVRLEHVRPGRDLVEAVVRARLRVVLRCVLLGDGGRVRHDERTRHRRSRPLELEDDRVLVRSLDTGDRLRSLRRLGRRPDDVGEVEVHVPVRDADREAPLDRVLHVRGRHLAIDRRAVPDAALDSNGDRLAVARDLGKAGGEVRDGLHRVGRNRVQRPVHPVQDLPAERVVGLAGIDRVDIPGRDQLQRAALLALLARPRAATHEEQRGRGERQHDEGDPPQASRSHSSLLSLSQDVDICGSRASRTASPSRLNASTVRTSARPGKRKYHHAESKSGVASAII